MSQSGKRKLIVSNLKMHRGDAAVFSLVSPALLSEHISLVICPSFIYLESLKAYRDRAGFSATVGIGGQDCAPSLFGSYTGQISAGMLKDVGCQYVIVGHAERRLYNNETNAIVQKKVECALHEGLSPIVCVGEPLEVRKHGTAVQHVMQQLHDSLIDTEKEIIIAYEPVWAIGGCDLNPTLAAIEEIIVAIKDKYSTHKLLYGGSVSEHNARSILSLRSIDGVLVGSASLDIKKMHQIIAAATPGCHS